MKVLINLCIIFSFISISTYAQNKWNLSAGYQRSDYTSDKSTYTHSNGLYAGINYETPLNQIENFYLEGEMLYSYTGDRDGNLIENIHEISIPLRVKYKINFTSNFGIFAYGGPNASFGIVATERRDNVSYSLYGKNGILNRFNVKLGIGAGLEFSKKLILRVGYDWGLLNISKIQNVAMYVNTFYAGLTYKF